jgi:hypothetical protein
VTPPVVENGLVGQVDDGFGLVSLDGVGEDDPGIVPRHDRDAPDLVQRIVGQLLLAAGQHGTGHVVTARPELAQGGSDHIRIVLSVYDGDVTDR